MARPTLKQLIGDADKIFRRGFTGGVSTGTGVGLSLARALVEGRPATCSSRSASPDTAATPSTVATCR